VSLPEPSGNALVDQAVRSADDKKAAHITILDLRGKSAPADWFIICEGDNIVQNRAIADGIASDLEKEHGRPWHQEGLEEGQWILLDYVNVIVHVMLPDARQFYALERFWLEGYDAERDMVAPIPSATKTIFARLSRQKGRPGSKR
jgi:ribosome-associated protein